MDIIILTNVTPKDSDNLQRILDRTVPDAVAADTLRKQKRAEYNKKYYAKKHAEKTESTESVLNVTESEKEEREEEKEGFPPSSPLPFSPNTPYPIPPIIPPSQEKEGEREENVMPTAEIQKPKPAKKKYGSGENVLLTDEEYEKLKGIYQDADDKIEAMSLYFSSKGNAGKYKSHYATLLNWARMDRERKAEKQRTAPKQNKTAYEMLEEMGLA